MVWRNARLPLMTLLPMVVRAEHRGGYRIYLVFNDGVESTVDFSDWLAGPVFEPLKDPGYFKRFFLDGGTVAWPNGADIAPETLYARTLRPHVAAQDLTAAYRDMAADEDREAEAHEWAEATARDGLPPTA